MDTELMVGLIWVVIAILWVSLLCLAIAVWKKTPPQIYINHEPPGENVKWVQEPEAEDFGGTVEFTLGEGQVLSDAELVADSVPVFIGDDRERQVGEAVVFKDEDRYNALVEIYPTDSEFYKEMTTFGIEHLSIAATPIREETHG